MNPPAVTATDQGTPIANASGANKTPRTPSTVNYSKPIILPSPPNIPFIDSRAPRPLLGMTLLILAIGIFLPIGPLADYFKLQPLPLPYFSWLAGILLSYALLTTLMKRYYIRRFGWQ